MSKPVRLTIWRQVREADILSALRGAGAENVSLDPRTGDPYEMVDRYFFIEFDDPEGQQRRRTASGFVASLQEGHLLGYTRLQLGSDERGRHFVAAVGRALGGVMDDHRVGDEVDFNDPATAAAPAYEAAAEPERALSPC